jgi:hypothetical protein
VAKWEGAFDAARWNEARGDKARGSGVSAKWAAERLSLVEAEESDTKSAGPVPARVA